MKVKELEEVVAVLDKRILSINSAIERLTTEQQLREVKWELQEEFADAMLKARAAQANVNLGVGVALVVLLAAIVTVAMA